MKAAHFLENPELEHERAISHEKKIRIKTPKASFTTTSITLRRSNMTVATHFTGTFGGKAASARLLEQGALPSHPS